MGKISSSNENFYNSIKQYQKNIDAVFGATISIEDTGFYELCKKFSDIGLNAPKLIIEETCDVQGCFQDNDINIAVIETVAYIKHWKITEEQYPVYDGIHEAIVSVEDWELAQQKRKKLGVKREKIYNLDHEHLLSGLLRCPVCGAAMYGNVNRKRKPDGTIYKDHFYYACKHRMKVDGHKCDYHRQWNQTKINGAVEEVIEKLVSNPEFEKALCEKINTRVSTEDLEKELAVFNKQLNQLVISKRKLAAQMDVLDVTDKHYDKKYQDMQNRLYSFYDEIEAVEENISELQTRIGNIKAEKISGENIYLFLHYYGTMYKEFTDAEKKKFLNIFIESVEIFKEEQPDGRLLKCINFKFPVFYDGDENVTHISWDGETTFETVVQLVRKNPDTHIDFEIDLDEFDLTSAESKATYQEIKDYVLDKFGLKVSSLYISQVKTKCGIIERENYNKGEGKSRVPQYTPEKKKP